MATKKKELSSVQRDSKGGRGILAPGGDKEELSNLLTGRKYFVEIGTCYFDTLNETLGDAGWHGVVVEPVVKYLNMLDRYNGITYINSELDTEGHDSVILSSIDFNNRALRPSLIKAETKHYDSNKVIELLESNGYLVFEEADDVYAIDKVVYL